MKVKQNRKWKIPYTVLDGRQSLCFSSYKNRKLKIKLWWVGARERKKWHFLYRLFCPKGIFLIFVAPYLNVLTWKCIEYIFRTCIILHTKKLLHVLLLLVFKIIQSLQRILKQCFIDKNLSCYHKTEKHVPRNNFCKEKKPL